MPNNRTISGFIASGEEITAKNWHNWYIKNTLMHLKIQQKKYTCKYKIKKAINLIDYDMVKNWVEDLIINKTFNGLYFQKTILMFLSERSRTFYKLATTDKESLGIDGYVGNTPYSIKPDTYKNMKSLTETISIKMIYYTKTKQVSILK